MPWLCGNATSLGVPNKNSLHVSFSWEEGEAREKWGRERGGENGEGRGGGTKKLYVLNTIHVFDWNGSAF